MDVIEVGGVRRFSREKAARFGLLDRPRLVCDLICLEPGQEEPHREHATSDELYYVIEGLATIRIGQHEYAVEAEQALLAPPGLAHWVANAGPGRLTVLAVVTPKPGREAEVAPRRPSGARPSRAGRPAVREERQPEWPGRRDRGRGFGAGPLGRGGRGEGASQREQGPSPRRPAREMAGSEKEGQPGPARRPAAGGRGRPTSRPGRPGGPSGPRRPRSGGPPARGAGGRSGPPRASRSGPRRPQSGEARPRPARRNDRGPQGRGGPRGGPG